MPRKPFFQYELASLVLLTVLTATALGAFGPWGLLAVPIVSVIVGWARLVPTANLGGDDVQQPEYEMNTGGDEPPEDQPTAPLEEPKAETAEVTAECTKEPADTAAEASPYQLTVPFRKGIATLLLFAITGVFIFGYIIKVSLEYSLRRQHQNTLVRTASLLHKYTKLNGHLPPPHASEATSWWFRGPDYSWRVVLAERFPAITGFGYVGLPRYNANEPWYDSHNIDMPNPLSDHEPYNGWPASYTDVLAVTGSQTAWASDDSGRMKPIPADREGLTIVLVKDDLAPVHWAEPRDLPFEQARILPQSLKERRETRLTDGIDVAFADGNVATISPDIPHEVWEALLSPNGPSPAFQRYLVARVKVSDWLAPLLFAVTIVVMLFRPQHKNVGGAKEEV